jgi:hypothetical protein
MYKTNLNNFEFLRISYSLMKKKIQRLIEIENSKKKNKLSLPLLKEKFEITSNILKAIKIIADEFDYDSDINELLSILNDFGILLGEANLSENSESALEKYNICIIILEGFLGE